MSESSSSSPNQNRRAIGELGEQTARAYLEARGYRWVASNFTTRAGEIDLIMEENDVLVIVEVKRRGNDSYGAPEEAVPVWKQRRMVRAALVFIKSRGITDRMIRFDVVGVEPDGVHHIPNAFAAEGNFYY